MSSATATRFARRLLGVVGALDLGSGLALIALPAWTLTQMQIVPPAGDEALAYVRFMAVFVAGLGAAYLLAAWRPGQGRLRACLVLTVPLRAGVALFAAVAVVTGVLPVGWWLVAVVDALLVGLQIMALQQGAGDAA